MLQARMWCPWTGGFVWVRSDVAHEFIAPGDVVRVRFIRVQIDGQDRPAKRAEEVGISDFPAKVVGE